MDVILVPFLAILNSIIEIYIFIIIVSVLLSWLISFDIINSSNNIVIMIREFLYRITEPVFDRIRRFLPIIGGFDLSPLVVILFLWFLQGVISQLAIKISMVPGV